MEIKITLLDKYQEAYIMERVEKFLKEAETYYLATVEGDQPRVRLNILVW